MKGRCAWTSVRRPTEPPHVSAAAAAATESQPEVWMRRDDSSLPGSRVNGSQPGNVIRLAQWPIEEHQRRHPTPSTPRRSSLGSDHSSTTAAARVIPLTRWPLSDPRGGRTAMFNTGGGTPRRTTCTGNRYVSDPCAGRQSSDLKFTRKYDNGDSSDVRVLKTNLFSVEGTDWSEEDSICVLSDGERASVNTNIICPPAKSMVLLKDIDRFGTNQYPLKDTGHSSVNQNPSNAIDSTDAHHHQRSLKCTDLSGEPCPLMDNGCTSRTEHRVSLQGKRGGEKCARLMSRLCHRQKRSKQHDTTL